MILAIAITIPLCLLLTIFTFELSYDLTLVGSVKEIRKRMWVFYNVAFSNVYFIFFIYLISGHKIASICALIYWIPLTSFFFIIDTQLLIGRKHKFMYRVTASLHAVFLISFMFFLLYMEVLLLIKVCSNM